MIAAFEPITVTIAHRLGRDEAKRRIDGGLGAIRRELASYVRSLEYHWQDDRLEFRAVVLLQTITGRIEVSDDLVRVELGLPRLLHLLARTIAGRIERRGTDLLAGPKAGS